MSDFQEGYCDGLAGAGMQDGRMSRETDLHKLRAYRLGFTAGSLDRKTMLTREVD